MAKDIKSRRRHTITTSRPQTLAGRKVFRCQIQLPTETLVEQGGREDCDINRVMAKIYRGEFQDKTMNRGMYGDFSNVTDYQTAKMQLLAAEATFSMLPAEIRKRFDNSPEKVLAFIDDPKNMDECIQMGLLEKTAREAPVAVTEQTAPPNEPASAEA